MIEFYERLPYSRPLAVPDTLKTVYRKPGYIFLSEALEIVGQDMFGGEWTGEEIKSRALPEPSNLFPVPLTNLGSDAARHGGAWRIQTSTGLRRFATEDAAMEVWKSERPLLMEMWGREHAARERYEQAVIKLRGDLNVGALLAWVHNPKTGISTAIAPDTWAREDIPSVFELGDSALKWANPNEIKISASFRDISGPVLILKSDVERLLDPANDVAGPAQDVGPESDLAPEPDNGEKPRPGNMKAQRSGGRPAGSGFKKLDEPFLEMIAKELPKHPSKRAAVFAVVKEHETEIAGHSFDAKVDRLSRRAREI